MKVTLLPDIQVPKKMPKHIRKKGDNFVDLALKMFERDRDLAANIFGYKARFEHNKTEADEQHFEYAKRYIKICGYCQRRTKYYVNSSFLYNGVNRGPVYHCDCKPEGVYVGCKKDYPAVPLGFPADKYLRRLRQQAHDLFDPLWQQYLEEDGKKMTQHVYRTACYFALAIELGIEDARKCHIAWFNADQCRKVKQLCKSGRLQVRLTAFRRLLEAQLTLDAMHQAGDEQADIVCAYITCNHEELLSIVFKPKYIKPPKKDKDKRKTQRQARKTSRKKK